MGVSLYEGISECEIDASRTTSEGKPYTINHPEELLVNMRYKGSTGSNSNSQGWERNSSYYFKELLKQHPEYFSKKNSIRIESGKSPIVDKKFADSFPQYKEFKGETMVHHHIGQDGQAVALPQSIHKGYGEIHMVEHDLGITDKAQLFSNSCEEACKRNQSLYGQTSDRFRSLHCERSKIRSYKREESSCEKRTTSTTMNSIKSATHSSLNTAGNNKVSNTHRTSMNQTRN